jgi:outer membrane protein, heavy metal efflux system
MFCKFLNEQSNQKIIQMNWEATAMFRHKIPGNEKATLQCYGQVTQWISKAAGFAVFLAATVCAQPPSSYTWQQLKEKFAAGNPALKATQAAIEEAKANEVTAFLKPNPQLNLSTDGYQLTPYSGVWRPLSGTQISTGLSYLLERGKKRDLRLEGSRQSTTIASTAFTDQERTLLFTLRTAYVQVLQAKAILQNAKDNLEYWDQGLGVQRKRYAAGDLALMDLNRLELIRVQFESDQEAATVSLRTAKIQLLNLLNDRTPIDQFDVTGQYDFREPLDPLEQFRDAALSTRPDLKAALQNVELSKINHRLAIANGTADPTFSGWYTHNPSFNNPFDYNTVGGSISIPLRIHDKNQGEKLRTQIDIGRSERLADVTRSQIFNDVDSAYYTMVQALNLLKPYKTKYLPLALDVRDRMAISYRNGGNSLLDYLDAQKAYRDIRLAYLNLIGSYLTASAQMNLATGREILE